MSAPAAARFDIAAVRAEAGDSPFARGEAYFREGRVKALVLDKDRVQARITGTRNYRAALKGQGRRFHGDCSWTAFHDEGFCKHLVALALAANAAHGEGLSDRAGTVAHIRAHLLASPVDALVDIIMEQADRDPSLLNRLLLGATAGSGTGDFAERRLRKAIDDATWTGEFIHYYEATGWANEVADVLDTIADLVVNGGAGLAVGLAWHAIERITQAAQHVDDTDEHCERLLGQAAEVHLAACLAQPPDPVLLARELFGLLMTDPYETFGDALERYADALGPAGFAEYRRLAESRWRGLPSQQAGAKAAPEIDLAAYRLAPIVDYFAELDDDVEARIAIRRKDLSSQWRYLQLAEFCLSQGRREEALRYAEEGLERFGEELADRRLVFFVADLLSGAGRREEGLKRLWQAFSAAPNLEIYAELRRHGTDEARDMAIASLREQVAALPPSTRHYRATLLVQVLIAEEMFAAAWHAARDDCVSDETRLSLAAASGAAYPSEAAAVYRRHVDALVSLGGNANYGEAHRFIARLRDLQDAGEQEAYLAGLRERFRRKRNFIAGLH